MDLIDTFGSWHHQKTDRELPPHRNPGLELVFLSRGNLAWDYDGRIYDVQAPVISFAFPWQIHSCATPRVPSCELSWVLLRLDNEYDRVPEMCHLNPALRLPVDDEAFILDTMMQSPVPVAPAGKLLATLFSRLIEGLARKDASVRIRPLINLILVELAHSLKKQPFIAPSPTARQRVSAFLSGRLPESCQYAWTLEEMAAACELGRTQFAEHLKILTGDSPVQMLNRLRTEKACHLLVGTSKRITDIAFSCGFQTSQYFARTFKEYAGCSPSQWRHSSGNRD